MASGSGDETKDDVVPDDTSFLVVAGALVESIKEIRDIVQEAGFEVKAEYNLDLSAAQAKEVLDAATAAAAEARAADEAAAQAALDADPKAKKAAEKERAKAAAARKAAGLPEVEDTPVYAETLNADELAALTEGRVAFMALHKGGGVEAVNELRSIVGPEDPAAWAEHADSLRARYGLKGGGGSDGGEGTAGEGVTAGAGGGSGGGGGKESEADDGQFVCKYNLLHTAFSRDHALAAVNLFTSYEMQERALNEDNGPSLRDLKKSDRVDLEQVYRFCFPEGQVHPRSTGRLIVFSQYGPFNGRGELTCGIRGSHVVTDLELRCMVDEIEQEDILAVYVKDKGMSSRQKQEVLVAADVAAKKLPNMTIDQIRSVLEKLPKDEAGTVSFHDLQKCVLHHRNLRLKEMKRMYPTVTSATGKPTGSAIRAPPRSFGRKLGRPADGRGEAKSNGLLDPTKKVSDTETFKVVTRLLTKEVHRISTVSEANSPGLTQNVRLLRDMPVLKKGGWDDTCCLRGTGRGSYNAAYKKK